MTELAIKTTETWVSNAELHPEISNVSLQMLCSKVLAAGLAAVAVSLLSTSVVASTVSLDYTTSNDIFGATDLFDRANLTVGTDTFRAAAGRFEVTDTTSDTNFWAWCIEVTQWLRLPESYEKIDGPDNDRTERLDPLFSGYFAEVDTAVEAASFQIAIWELMSDDVADLSDGFFQASGNDDAIAGAQAYLDNLDEQETGLYDLTLYRSADSQDLISANWRVTRFAAPAQVPVPGAGLALIGGLGALAAMRRLKKKA